MNKKYYQNNESLKAAGAPVNFTLQQVEEYRKCAADPIYFLRNYAKIVSLDKGIINFDLFSYQERMINAMHENRYIISMLPRQMGKSTVVAGYVAWYVTFNDNKNAVILANKQLIAQEIFGRVKMIIENLPYWMQSGISKWDELSFKLENGSKCSCAATSPASVRGNSINMLILDEFSHLKPKLADEFIASVFPTISSAKSSKMIIVSTPKGMNHFHKLWSDAQEGKNDFVAIEAKWNENPNRDQEWADKELKTLGPVRFAQEVECSFAGSSRTLVDGTFLSNLASIAPVFEQNNLKIYKHPEKEHRYTTIVDTSRGQHLDYSAFAIIDITKMPYEVVATYKDNTISTSAYPFLITQTAKKYNDAYILIEVNDAGGEIANTIWYEFEYENLYFTHKDTIAEGLGYPGIRTTKKVKAVGCSTLKELIETDQLILNSYDMIQELSVFTQKGASYAAEDTMINDDLTTCLWLFAYLTKQQIFSDLTSTNIRAILAKQQEEYMQDNMIPFGIIDDGTETEEVPLASYVIDNGRSPLENWMLGV
jgi:hypothetical protein